MCIRDSYDRGHWLNGRSSNASLSSVIAELCSGIAGDALDVSGARGIVRGYGLSEITSPRAALQPLTLAFPTDAIEREGQLRFVARSGWASETIDPQRFVQTTELEGSIERTRAADIETPSQIRLTFLEAEADFAATTVSASAPDGQGNNICLLYTSRCV